jgi:alkylation response protein AidB-like acyl-CoA dehydrogenase
MIVSKAHAMPLAGIEADAVLQDARRAALLSRLRDHLPAMQARAADLDAQAQFPRKDILALQSIGAMIAPLPSAFGGMGLGTEPAAAECLSEFLQTLGYAHVALGRLYEAHVNAIRLIAMYGTPSQIRRAADDCAAGRLLGLWVTDDASNPLRADASGALQGVKAICSGAGQIARSLVTCIHPDGTTRLAYLSTEAAAATPLAAALQGVRAATTGRIDFEGASIAADDWIGRPGDYLREPDFSGGAWRTSAVTAGCLASLVDLAIADLSYRNRAKNPHQQTRLGRAWIARETARLWSLRAARIAEGADPADPETVVATVNFARIAIEAACVETLNLVERSIGLPAFLIGTAIERVRRDLATYLRQPAPDDVLTEAAAHIIRTRTARTGQPRP